jgi:hypothetical protein
MALQANLIVWLVFISTFFFYFYITCWLVSSQSFRQMFAIHNWYYDVICFSYNLLVMFQSALQARLQCVTLLWSNLNLNLILILVHEQLAFAQSVSFHLFSYWIFLLVNSSLFNFWHFLFLVGSIVFSWYTPIYILVNVLFNCRILPAISSLVPLRPALGLENRKTTSQNCVLETATSGVKR